MFLNRIRERMFQGAKVPGSESTRERKFQGTKIPGSESPPMVLSLPRAKVRGNESSSYRLYYLHDVLAVLLRHE